MPQTHNHNTLPSHEITGNVMIVVSCAGAKLASANLEHHDVPVHEIPRFLPSGEPMLLTMDDGELSTMSSLVLCFGQSVLLVH